LGHDFDRVLRVDDRAAGVLLQFADLALDVGHVQEAGHGVAGLAGDQGQVGLSRLVTPSDDALVEPGAEVHGPEGVFGEGRAVVADLDDDPGSERERPGTDLTVGNDETGEDGGVVRPALAGERRTVVA
jgi:hypothetical protein